MSLRTLTILVAAALILAISSPAFAQGDANVRVMHASPDAPAVDVLVDGNAAFTNLAFPNATDYASLGAATYNVQVVPTGATEPVVIDADLGLDAGTSYTVLAVGTLDNIEPLVLTDNRAAPAAGKAHVRIVHASPDAPAVDVAVADGPVLFSDLSFKEATEFTPVDAGTYDLQVRPTGTDDVALALNGTTLREGDIVTVVARGLLDDGSLDASVITYEPMADAADMPETMPKTGGTSMIAWLLLLGAAILGMGATLRFAGVKA